MKFMVLEARNLMRTNTLRFPQDWFHLQTTNLILVSPSFRGCQHVLNGNGHITPVSVSAASLSPITVMACQAHSTSILKGHL